MRSNWTVDKLKDFENFVADIFNKGEIKAPVHLSDGNEKELIEIFNKNYVHPHFKLFSDIHHISNYGFYYLFYSN